MTMQRPSVSSVLVASDFKHGDRNKGGVMILETLFNWSIISSWDIDLVNVCVCGGGGASFNSPGWHMNTCHCLKVCCVSQQSEEHGGDSSWQAVTLRELDRAIEGLNPSVGLVYTLYRMSMPRAIKGAPAGCWCECL